jgi:hypothetical protein
VHGELLFIGSIIYHRCIMSGLSWMLRIDICKWITRCSYLSQSPIARIFAESVSH